ncbi:GTPase-activating protein [Coemansia sp. RSA 2530]|nr:GTPase-activating protein [Coemansia sp. S85]KAJ2417567.1 GTPase-activating protein [Coemansia sp. RSA 2530]
MATDVPPVKKSLRSKRLMRPGSNAAKKDIKTPDPDILSPVAAAETDTETLKASGRVDPGSDEEEFVEASESQTSSRQGSPLIKGGRPRLDSSFGGQPTSLSTVGDEVQELGSIGEPLVEFGSKIEETMTEFGTKIEEPLLEFSPPAVVDTMTEFGTGAGEEPKLFDFGSVAEPKTSDFGSVEAPTAFDFGSVEAPTAFDFDKAEEPTAFDFDKVEPKATGFDFDKVEPKTTGFEFDKVEPTVFDFDTAAAAEESEQSMFAVTPAAEPDTAEPAVEAIVSEAARSASPIPEAESTTAAKSGLGRSISLRYGGNSLSNSERRRPSLSAKTTNRRSIMLTSFVPPVGMSGGPSSNSSTSTRSSNDSDRPPASADDAKRPPPDMGMAPIRLRPSTDAGQPLAAAKPALPSISEGDGGPPKWVMEVQKRTLEPPIAEDDDLPLTEIDLSPAKEDQRRPLPPVPASPSVYVAQAASPVPPPSNVPARSIYRSLSASLGIAQTPEGSARPAEGERQRSTSQASTAAASSPVQSGGLFAAVTSFFGRTSTQASSSEAPVGEGKVAFPGMRPSQSVEAEAGDMDSLLHQLEAQNAQILGDNKARVFSQPVEAPMAEESADWDFWGNLISDYERVSRTSPRKLARAVHAGIPTPIRGTVWQLMSGSRAEAELLGAAFRRLQAASVDGEQAKHEKLIRQDVARTFPRDAFFRDGGPGQEGLYAVLRAYSLYDAGVGYCQGLAFVVGPLLLHMPDEEAFCVLVRLMAAYGLRGHFLPAMDDLHLRLFQFDHVLHATLPRLAKHLDAQGVKPTMYASQWLMTLFAYRLPLHLAVRLFDVVFAEGLDALLRVAVAVLKRSQARLLALEFEGIVHYLNDGPLFAFYAHAAPDTLVRDANMITAVTPRLLQTLRRKYVEEAERRMDEEDEMARLRAEIESLKRENRQLAGGSDLDRLAQKNVQLAVRNQQLEEALGDLEAALVQIKVLYAESESEKAALAMKLDGLRKALT